MDNFSGLMSKEATERLRRYGPNEIPEKKSGFAKKLFRWLFSPIALMLMTAAFLSLYAGKRFDFLFITSLMLLNFLVSFWQEHKADAAIKKLNEKLVRNANVLRDGSWREIPAKGIVPGDVVKVGVGDIVPADGKILQAKNLTVNEAVLTGESLSKEKQDGGDLYSGSFVSTGLARFGVAGTGANTHFGKTIMLVERSEKKSSLEKDILRISKLLSVASFIAVVVLSAAFILGKYPLTDLLTLDLSLVIAGIPIGLPTVMTLVIELGVIELARQNAVVRRLSALEDFANVNLLLTDKTGTLTKNEINVQEIVSYGGASEKDVLFYAYLSALQDNGGDISRAIITKAEEEDVSGQGYELLDFTPSDSERKRSSVVVKISGKVVAVAAGAPQVIKKLSSGAGSLISGFERNVEDFAAKGYRSLAIAVNKAGQEEKDMELIGILVISDTLRADVGGAIDFMKEKGIAVKIVTGDNSAISREIACKIGLRGDVYDRNSFAKIDWSKTDENWWGRAAVFSEILPEDKYKLVRKAKERFVVAATGDGVNDLPALKEANVGIAVKNAVDALRAAADIVLTSQGISVIKNAILESRKIFARLYSYSIYRISESLRLIITIAVIGIWYGLYPLTPLQIILLAFLNDIPIIALAFDRVKIANKPAKIDDKKRFCLSSLFGLAGVANSLILFFVMTKWLHLNWEIVQTIFFLKLTVSGHMLIWVAHTKERWYKFLPSKEVIWATVITQILATIFSLTGVMMPGKISLGWAALVWGWAFFWMQITDGVKLFQKSAAISGTEAKRPRT